MRWGTGEMKDTWKAGDWRGPLDLLLFMQPSPGYPIPESVQMHVDVAGGDMV